MRAYLQSWIRKNERKLVTVLSFAVVLVILVWWYFSIYTQETFPIDSKGYFIEDLVGLGLQRQLYWGVIALSSFIGFFEFLALIPIRKNAHVRLRLYGLVFLGFVGLLTYGITKLADGLRWIAQLEIQGDMPISKSGEAFRFFLEGQWLPIFVALGCLLFWLVYLCLFMDRVTKSLTCSD